MSSLVRIGTRGSELALFQANLVKQHIENLGHRAVLVPITSSGDVELTKPLYEMGITGIFTKSLDIALLNGSIDLAVHSMKDVPTLLPKGIVQVAVLEREDATDVLVAKEILDFNANQTIATGSLRRKAQWLNKFPHHTIENIRGNLKLRLEKLNKNDFWGGAVFAKAGLNRISVNTSNVLPLDWMISAPAQGAIVVHARSENTGVLYMASQLNHNATAICTHVEREFLNALEGGCTAPIGAKATIVGETLVFKGVLLNVDGTQRVDIERCDNLNNYKTLGRQYAEFVKKNGGDAIINALKHLK